MGNSDKTMVSFRVSQDTKAEIEEYADEQDISQSEAFRRLIRKGSELENSGITISIGKEGDESLVTDGGAITEEIARNRSKINQVKEQVGQSETAVDRMTLSLVFAVLWVVSVITLDPPAWSVIPQGVVLIAALGALFYYKR